MPKKLGKGFSKVIFKLKGKPFDGEGDGDKGGDKSGDKGGDKKIFSAAETQELLEVLKKEGAELTPEQVAKLTPLVDRSLLRETMDRKQKLRELSKKEQEAQDAALQQQGKFKELAESLQPKAKRLEALEPVLEELLGLEIADIPEDKRDLIPDGPVEQKLKWVKNAKAKGLFGTATPPKKEPPKSENGKPNAHGATPEFVSWGADDKRLQSLTTSEYQVWKSHNRGPKKGLVGWGGT